MTPNEFQKEALRTVVPARLNSPSEAALRVFTILGIVSNPTEDISLVQLLEGLIGLQTESSESFDILKKTLFQGHMLDKEHVADELGDVAWYLAIAADAIGYELEDILLMNVAKREERYPDGFSTEQSLNRTRDLHAPL